MYVPACLRFECGAGEPAAHSRMKRVVIGGSGFRLQRNVGVSTPRL